MMQPVARTPALGEEVLGLMLRIVLIANHGDEAKLHNATEHASSNVGTARVVANVFPKNFFAAVRSRHARLNRYLRNRESLLAEDLNYVMDRGLWRK